MTTFAEFNKRYTTTDPHGFFACIDPLGYWFDSAERINTAMTWCMYWEEGSAHEQNEADWFNTEGRKLGYSIVHSSTLEKMYNAGLIT